MNSRRSSLASVLANWKCIKELETCEGSLFHISMYVSLCTHLHVYVDHQWELGVNDILVHSYDKFKSGGTSFFERLEKSLVV
jgi:hypothetical protein